MTQILQINWLTQDSIEFKLIAKNELCDYETQGIAVNKYPNMDPEIDEDANGMAYPVIEYQVIDGGNYLVSE